MDFTTELNSIKKEKKLVEIYTDKNNPDSFCFGFIIGFDSDFIFINAVSCHGETDGLTIRRLKDIYRVEYDGDYEKRLAKLFNLKKQAFDCYPVLNDLNTLLKTVIEDKVILTITTGDFENHIVVAGIIEKVVNNKIYFREIKNDCQSGIAVFATEDIYDINCFSKDEKDIQLLYEYKQK